MKRSVLKVGLILALLAQMAVLGGLFAYSQYPLWVGQEVRVATLPVDPRDLFRGQYVRLGYDFSRLPIPEMELPRIGDDVYVPLEVEAGPEPETRMWRAGAARLRPPQETPFLRGRITRVSGGQMFVRYGIEAWFAPPEEARRLETELRDGATVRLKVTASGRAALLAVEVAP